MTPKGEQNIKWMTALSVWLFLAMTAALVTTKVSLLWLLRLYKYEQIHPATWYVIILILLETPLLTQVVHLVWNTPFITGHRLPLPKVSHILLGILGSVSEGIAGTVFACEISHTLPEPILLLLPGAVFTFHVILGTSEYIKMSSHFAEKKINALIAAVGMEASVVPKANGKQLLQICCNVLMGSYLLWVPAVVGTLLHLWSSFNLKLGACLALPVAMLVLAATWAPKLQSAIVRVNAKGKAAPRNHSSLSLAFTLCRVVAIPTTLYIIMFFKIDAFRNDPMEFLQHVADDVTDLRVWFPVLLACVFGLVSVMVGGVASKVALMTSGMRIPALVTPFVSLGLATLLWKDLESAAFWELSGSDVVTWTATGVALIGWLIPFAVPGIPAIKTPTKLLRPFSENFFSFSWRPFFLEQYMMLNTNVGEHCDNSDRNVICEKSAKEISMRRVFICTTMYRETDMEMRRYLNSLKRTFTSNKLLNVALEAHVIVDSCIDEDLSINTHARQLLELATEVLHVDQACIDRYTTPYGCQVSFRCIGGHKLFVHLKNGREFKPKKRWSQVMYINYILSHRAPHNSATSHNQQSAASAAIFYTASSWGTNMSTRDEPRNGFSGALLERMPNIWVSGDAGAMHIPASLGSPRRSCGPPSQLTSARSLPVSQCKRPAIVMTKQGETENDSVISSHDTSSDTVPASSFESTTSCNCSDLDDDSDGFSFQGRVTGNCYAAGSQFSELLMRNWLKRPDAGKTGAGNKTDTSARTHYHEANSSGDCKTSYWSEIPLHNTQMTEALNAGLPEATSSRKSKASESFRNSPTVQTEKLPLEEHLQAEYSTACSLPTSHNENDEFYILATDADIEFSGRSVRKLVDLCEADHSLGAVCGRTVPIGGCKPIVWYQKFEYAKDFWLVKSSQNVIGSVTCCPGCFSLYRGSAISDVIETFSCPSVSAYDTLVKDHGEDRWLCTLLMQKGWKLEYADNCRNTTHCPETCGEFLRQRRRWVLSELSNMLLIFQGLRRLIKGNATFSAIFILSLLHMFVWVLLSPSTTLVVTCVGFHILFSVPLLYSVPACYTVLLAYFALCVLQPRHTQRLVTQAIVVVMIGVMVATSIGFVDYVVETLKQDLADGHVVFKPYFLVLVLVAGTVYAALLHCREGPTLIYGLMYAAMFPAMFVTLPIYSIANMVDTSWGTREAGTGSRACCDVSIDDPDVIVDRESEGMKFSTANLPSLASGGPAQVQEHQFWNRLKQTVLGCNVNCGESERNLQMGLFKLRNQCVLIVFLANSAWYAVMTSVYIFVSSDVVCYAIASLFSFSLLVQLVGMTSYKVDEFLKRYIVRKLQGTESVWVREKS